MGLPSQSTQRTPKTASSIATQEIKEPLRIISMTSLRVDIYIVSHLGFRRRRRQRLANGTDETHIGTRESMVKTATATAKPGNVQCPSVLEVRFAAKPRQMREKRRRMPVNV